jgi:hypothetical protein
VAADAQRDDERLAWLELMRRDLDQARAEACVAPADVERIGAQLEAILLCSPPDARGEDHQLHGRVTPDGNNPNRDLT